MSRRIAGIVLLLATTAQGQVAGWSIPTTAAGDTLIEGRRYRRVAAELLVDALTSDRQVSLQGVAIIGPLNIARWVDTLRAELQFTDVHIASEVNVNGVTIVAPMHLRGCTFASGLSGLRTQFTRGVDLTGSRFMRHVALKGASFADSSTFDGARFQGTLSLIDARFTAPVSFRGASFSNGAYFEDAVMTEADFEDAIFENVTSFRRTRFTGPATFAAARFYAQSWFWNSHFAGSATFDDIKVIAQISFREMVVDGEASFRKSSFVYPASFVRTNFHGKTTFVGSRFKRDADLSAVHFRQGVRLHAAFWQNLDLREARGPWLELKGPPPAAPGSPVENVLSDTSVVLLQGLAFDELRVRWSDLAGRLAADDAGTAGLEGVYAYLGWQFREQGLAGDASACAMDWLQRRASSMPWTEPGRWASEFLWVTTGSGRQPHRLGIWTLAVLLLFAAAYRFVGGAAAKPEPWGRCLRRSATAFLRLLPVSPRTHAHDCTTGVRWLQLLESLLGWVTLALFVAVVTVHMLL